MLLPHSTKTLPRGRKKDSLRDSGNIASCMIGPNDNEETVNEKIITLFPSLRVAGFKMMTTTKSGDVFEAEKLPNFDGETILEFIGNGPLLLQSRAAIVAPISVKQNPDDFQEIGIVNICMYLKVIFTFGYYYLQILWLGYNCNFLIHTISNYVL